MWLLSQLSVLLSFDSVSSSALSLKIASLCQIFLASLSCNFLTRMIWVSSAVFILLYVILSVLSDVELWSDMSCYITAVSVYVSWSSFRVFFMFCSDELSYLFSHQFSSGSNAQSLKFCIFSELSELLFASFFVCKQINAAVFNDT